MLLPTKIHPIPHSDGSPDLNLLTSFSDGEIQHHYQSTNCNEIDIIGSFISALNRDINLSYPVERINQISVRLVPQSDMRIHI